MQAFPRPGTFGFCPVSDEGAAAASAGASVCWRVRAVPPSTGKVPARRKEGAARGFARRASQRARHRAAAESPAGRVTSRPRPSLAAADEAPAVPGARAGCPGAPGVPAGGARAGAAAARGRRRGPEGGTRSGGGGRLRAPRSSQWASLVVLLPRRPGCHSQRGQPEVDNRLGRRPLLRSSERGRPCQGCPAPGMPPRRHRPGSSRPNGDGSPLPSACEYALRTRRSETRRPPYRRAGRESAGPFLTGRLGR
ncbi:hypothetical protein Bbelb_269960 [Branchiostoma belcheri]|nr:hypothetical protein Bbelb_269960 [Branchiostoma belcheri]